jgi:two-component system chemotaxis response regulator CheY
MKALVVENSDMMRSVLRRILSMRGFEVAEADNAKEALDVLHSMGEADLVFVDWLISEVDSLEFISRLRLEAPRDTMVIMLAVEEPELRTLHRALRAGADDYLMRPFTALQIDEKLTQAGFTWQP